jgi:hypothetical protein
MDELSWKLVNIPKAAYLSGHLPETLEKFLRPGYLYRFCHQNVGTYNYANMDLPKQYHFVIPGKTRLRLLNALEVLFCQ